jgi:hypothetical protein
MGKEKERKFGVNRTLLLGRGRNYSCFEGSYVLPANSSGRNF